LLILGSALLLATQYRLSAAFIQTNLVSDVPLLAQTTDPNLKNPWGVSFSATSPFWVSDQVMNEATLYSGTGSTITPLVVSVAGGPTGQVFNSTTGFVEADGTAASFIFDTLSGGIYAWNSGNVTTAQLQASATAMFTGLALDNNGSGNFLYAASAGGIDVFNSSFAPVVLSGSFADPGLPAGYVPYNIQNIGGQLYVEYASFGTGKGAVSVFDANGNLLKELIAPGGTHLNVPWGVVVAPAGFTGFANDLLVGNFGNGEINAFDPTTGAFLGTLTDTSGNPIVDSGLWSLAVRTGGTFDTSAVYFTAGINGQKDGLFGKLDPIPEPSALGLAALGGLAVGLLALRRRITEDKSRKINRAR
jgi:uncharacterized protein (TIGR03118 family)